MSQEVDQRVVEMRFDNAKFEKNVQQSINSLNALNKSLKFKGAEKGFAGIQKASEKTDFCGMENALESLNDRFSTLSVMGTTALVRITNQAITTGERLVKALSLDPIISGFQEYETQISAVQTILANTSSKGTTLDQVNAALDELNHYADLTIYNFTEMTRNIGTFTAAGVDLDTSVAAIKGIANLAAVSGSTSQQASTAMYQLSQALASGTVKLQDWNSVVNAGMGGQVFQDALKETARVHGVAIDSMIAKEGSFRETLSKGWLTSSILTETLQKFTGDLNEETLKSIGYTDEQIKKIMEMGKTANDAATKVKTFSQLKDTLAEALQSGWTQTWQTVIGDFEEAKELFTKFSDVLSDLINKSSEARNTVLEGGLNSGWQQLSTALGDSADFYSQMLEKVMLANGSISQKQINDAGSFAKALQYGGVSAEQLQNGLDESTQQLQALSKLSDKELMAKGLDPTQVKALTKSFEEVNQKIADGSLNLDTYSKKIGELSGREHLIQSIWNIFEAIGEIGTAVAAFVAEFWPYILVAVAIIAVLAGIAALFNKKNKDAAEAGKDYDKNFSEGITDGKDTVKEAIRDMTDDATDTMASAIFDLHKTADDAFDLTPSITPIVDLSDMESSAQAMDEVFGTYDMTGDVSRKLAAQVDAQTEIQNGAKERSGTELLNAVNALGDRMDSVGESIRGMKMVVDGNKAIGYIDTKLGERSARRMR